MNATKWLVAASLLVAMPMLTQAQNRQSGKARGPMTEEQINRQTDKAAKNLNLSDDQKTKYKAAMTQRAAANQPLIQKLQGSTTPDERKQIHQSIAANNKKFRDDLYAMLDASQKQKLDSLDQQRRSRPPHKKPGISH